MRVLDTRVDSSISYLRLHLLSMPGPRGRGNKNRPKASSSGTSGSAHTSMPAYTIPEGFFADIDNGATWAVIVDYLCKYFELPGMCFARMNASYAIRSRTMECLQPMFSMIRREHKRRTCVAANS